MEHFNLLNTPAKIVRIAPTITIRHDRIVFNKAASQLLALKPKDRISFDYDKEKYQLFMKIDPNGFFLSKKDSSFSFRSQALSEKLIARGIAFGVYYLGEFKDGLWPLTWMK